MKQTIAIVGAGMSGAACARELSRRGWTVTLFEKSRGVGGRMATRRTAVGTQFDHGAQYFTVRDPVFRDACAAWLAADIIGPWPDVIGVLDRSGCRPSEPVIERFVGISSMNSACKYLLDGLEVHGGCRVSALEWTGDGWYLVDDQHRRWGGFGGVVLSCPPPQTAELLRGEFDLADAVASVRMLPCWAVMVELLAPLAWNFSAAFVNDGILSWIARDSSKPGRSPAPVTWVLHAGPEWSRENLERAPGEIADRLVQEFRSWFPHQNLEVRDATAHRWRFAIPDNPLSERCLWNPRERLGVCGDWCGGPRVEGAYLSGWSLARRICDED